MSAFEYNFDGLVGPTHNYAGLARGNVASTSHALQISHPKQAALQGLQKMKALKDLGIKQALLPPQERPNLFLLRDLGFCGSDEKILEDVFKSDFTLALQVYSASAMWTANAATVSPSVDCADKRVHFTPANLTSKFHRSLETQTTTKIFKKIFANENHFMVHSALPSLEPFADEGAANHTRFCKNFDKQGLEFFTFGRYAFQSGRPKPKHFHARQTYEASLAISRRHQLNSQLCVFAQQSPVAVDAGVFHNDVISVGHQNVFLYHDQAFFDTQKVLDELQTKYSELHADGLYLIKIAAHEVTLQECVQSYLFNSQIATLPNGSMALIAPTEASDNKVVRKNIEKIISSPNNPITEVRFFNLRESMKNGGGPACLRLRVVLTDVEAQNMHPGILLTESLYQDVSQWIEKHYRETLTPEDLRDPNLLVESRTALDELTQLLRLGSLYEFQS